MTAPEIRFELIRVGEIRSFAERVVRDAGPGGWVPITLQRAAALEANPYATTEDPALIVGYRGDQWVAYVGLLAGRLKSARGLTKLFWVSTVNVDPSCRGQGVGGGLMRAMQALGHDVMGTEVTDSATRLYKSFDMREVGPLIRYRATLAQSPRVSAGALPARALRRLLGLAGLSRPWLDRFIEASARAAAVRARAAAFHRLAEQARGEHDALDYRLEEEPFPPGSPPAFLPDASTSSQPNFYRGPEVIEWMLRHKWVIEDDGTSEDVRYVFSHARHRFRYAHATLTDHKGEQVGSMLFLVSQRSEDDPGDVKVLDFQLASGVSRAAVVPVLLDVASRLDAAAIDFPDAFRLGLLAGGGPIDVEAIERSYFCMNIVPGGALEEAADELVLNFCDSDAAFV